MNTGDLWGADRLTSAEALSAEGLHPSWAGPVADFLASAEGQRLKVFLAQRLAAGAVVYPSDPFRALRLTALPDVRVVIVGQDPYHGPGQAEGLAFSVSPGIKVPPSLRNIHKEVWRDLAGTAAALPAGASGTLVPWARQGVLLLNTCLTVEDGTPAAHAKRGWEGLTSALLQACSQQAAACVFMLWGSHAQALAPLIDATRHKVLCSNHPSPLSASRGPAPFIGNGHFGLANQWLAERNANQIAWLEIFQKTMA